MNNYKNVIIEIETKRDYIYGWFLNDKEEFEKEISEKLKAAGFVIVPGKDELDFPTIQGKENSKTKLNIYAVSIMGIATKDEIEKIISIIKEVKNIKSIGSIFIEDVA